MTNLRKLGAACVLVCTLALTAFGDCPVPGQMDGPPCVPAVQLAPDDSPAPGVTGTSAAVAESFVELTSLVEIAFNVLTLY